MQEEEVVKADLKAADELLSDATAKLHDALSATALTLLRPSETKQCKACRKLEKREKC